MDIRIKNIVSNFDYERVHKTMEALGWTWFHSSTETKVPSIGEIVISSIELMEELLSDKYKGSKSIGTGGLYVRLEDDVLSLEFIVTDWNCDKEGNCY